MKGLKMWEIITRIADTVGILTFIIFIATILHFWLRTKRYKKMLLKRTQGKKIALAVSLKSEENIKGQVQQYLKDNKIEMEIEEIDKHNVSLDTLPELRKEFIEIKRKINDLGAKEVHLFYEGPVSVAFFLADALNNWIPVYIYHFHREKGYECWGLLTESLEKQATEKLVKELTSNV